MPEHSQVQGAGMQKAATFPSSYGKHPDTCLGSTSESSPKRLLAHALRYWARFMVATAAISSGILFVHPCYGQGAGSFDGCPLEGQTTKPALIALNRLKNRTATPLRTQVDPAISLSAVLAPGNDATRWQVTQGAIISGYVVGVKPGGAETVNCLAKDPKHTDTHIELALAAGDSDGTHHMIVEVSPRMRAAMAAKGKDWSTANLRRTLLGHKIMVVGWMMIDKEHCNASENTNPGGAHNWRATCWEVHPVTALGPAQ
jgi:hypothetical protein